MLPAPAANGRPVASSSKLPFTLRSLTDKFSLEALKPPASTSVAAPAKSHRRSRGPHCIARRWTAFEARVGGEPWRTGADDADVVRILEPSVSNARVLSTPGSVPLARRIQLIEPQVSYNGRSLKWACISLRTDAWISASRFARTCRSLDAWIRCVAFSNSEKGAKKGSFR
jgi:hypothetical protein